MVITVGYWEYRGFVTPIKYLLEYKNVEYIDKQYPIGEGPEFEKTEWERDRSQLGLHFPNLPYLLDGDVKITQSTVIMHYLARKYALYPKDGDLLQVELIEQQAIDFREFFGQVTHTGNYEILRTLYKDHCGPELQVVLID